MQNTMNRPMKFMEALYTMVRKSLMPKGSNQVFIGILCNAIEQIKDSTPHDNSHQALRTAANAADVRILCKSSR